VIRTSYNHINHRRQLPHPEAANFSVRLPTFCPARSAPGTPNFSVRSRLIITSPLADQLFPSRALGFGPHQADLRFRYFPGRKNIFHRQISLDPLQPRLGHGASQGLTSSACQNTRGCSNRIPSRQVPHSRQEVPRAAADEIAVEPMILLPKVFRPSRTAPAARASIPGSGR